MSDQKIKITVEAKDQTRQELSKTRAELDQTKKAAAEARKIMEARSALGVRPYKEIRDEIAKLRGSYDTLKKSGTLSAQDLYQAQQKLKQKTAELRKETGDWSGELSKAKGGFFALAGAGYAVVKSFERYSDFCQRMGEVNTLIDVSKEKFGSLTDEIRAMTKEIPQSAAELAAAQYDILSAGVALEKSVGVLELSAKAAVAGVTDTKTAANAGIAVINAYGKSIDELGSVYDILFQTVKLGVTTFPELSHHIGEVLPTARAANVGLKDVSASIVTLTKAGIRTPQAMTALKGAINAMAAPADEAKKVFDMLGITWQGLIPTLDAIRKKTLSLDQMRGLIPDVEARTGVLAMIQNYDELIKSLGEMDKAAGSTSVAYDKMKDTPANQTKLFRNEIDELVMSAGALAATGLLPLMKALRLLIDSMREADPLTKGLVLTLAGAAAAFSIWQLGLKNIVVGLKGFIVQASAAQAAAGSLAMQLDASGLAMKFGLAAAAIYTSYQLVQLGKEIYLAIQAAKEAEQSQERLRQNSDRLMRKYAEFKDVKIPGDLTEAAQDDLVKLQRQLASARVYYTALKAKLEEKAKETMIFGSATEEAKAAQKELAAVNARLQEIQKDFERVSEAASGTAEAMKKPAQAVLAAKEQLDEFEKQAKKAYEEAKKQAEDYAKKAIEWEEKIKYARLSTQDKIRDLKRKGIDEELAWNDRLLQAEEKLSAAKEALKKGDFELAEKLAKQSEDLYADLAAEVKKTEGGKDVVAKSLEETKQIAIDGVTEVGRFVEELYGRQKSAAETAAAQWTTTADGIKAQLDEIAKEREANVKITLMGLESAQNAINNLVKDETKHITVVTRHVEAKAAGGIIGEGLNLVKAAAGRLLGGYGGGDKINTRLEAGEGVVRKEAIRKYGAAFFHAYNDMRLTAADIVRASLRGLTANISLPPLPAARYAFQEGGIVPGGSPGESMTIRFQAGNAEMPLRVMGSARVTRSMVKEFERELVRMGLAK